MIVGASKLRVSKTNGCAKIGQVPCMLKISEAGGYGDLVWTKNQHKIDIHGISVRGDSERSNDMMDRKELNLKSFQQFPQLKSRQSHDIQTRCHD